MDVLKFLFTIGYGLLAAQFIATWMWVIGWWCYLTEASYRILYGKPRFWFWKQMMDSKDINSQRTKNWH